MAKKLDLNLGKREIKPARKIEDTHAAPAGPVAKPAAKKVPRRRREEPGEPTEWKVKSVRLKAKEWEKLEKWLSENGKSFSGYILELLEREDRI